MKYPSLALFLFIVFAYQAKAQKKSPDSYLGYELGSHFTPHEKVISYFKYLSEGDQNIRLIPYGKTYEGRELMVAVISSKENIQNLEEIRKDNLALSKAQKGVRETKNQPAILWLSYNVHGNEASSTETAMRTLFALVEGKSEKIESWLKNTIVIIDPCLNPDGRERYVNYFNSVVGKEPNSDPMAREHSEPWPGGRPNHYYFDLNRDWAWQTQIETQQRLKLYQQWMPEVHVDFHEQSYNEPYYFAPAAEPIHVDITPWQRAFQITVGKNNAKYFDENGWQYFTKERFDLLYPSYGDTYPLYNGAIGMTYEQGGIGAGLSVVTVDGDTLTLKDRIDHHYTTGMATVETVSAHAGELVEKFKGYFEKNIVSPPGIYKTYIVKAENLGKIKMMSELLAKNNIEFSFGTDKVLKGYNYETKKIETFKTERNDLIVNLQQPRAVLANVLFEPQTSVSDSNTYDITAWALPYVYGLKTYAIKESVKGNYASIEEKNEAIKTIDRPYAWAIPMGAMQDFQALIALQKAKIKVRIAEVGLTIGGRELPSGTLLVYRTENERIVKGLSAKIAEIQKSMNKVFYPIASGFVEQGKDLGSSVYPILNIPKVAIVSGTGVSSQGVGTAWHFFEQELKYPVTLISIQGIGSLDLNKINVLIMPDGSYPDNINEKLEEWIRRGGKVVLIEDAISAVVGKKPFDIKLKEAPKEEIKINAASRKYGERNLDDLSNSIPGAIFKIEIDQSHPLAAGLGSYYYALKTDSKVYEPLSSQGNVGLLNSSSYMAGVAGKAVMKKLDSGMLFGVQNIGRGSVVYMASDVLFRSFWENGKKMFTNAVFLVN
ncbi:M14 metallopeptidase family protein [Pedobacter metabolipauper]|nr:M14 metallopeptidase family protein [Pedobacter metabolipauper]